MTGIGDAIWIISRNYHTEGLGIPIIAFEIEDNARAAFAAMTAAADCALKLFRVPLWPDVVQQQTEEMTP